MPDFKAILPVFIGAILAMIAYDMFVKKALKLDTYESLEEIE